MEGQDWEEEIEGRGRAMEILPGRELEEGSGCGVRGAASGYGAGGHGVVMCLCSVVR